MSGHFLYIFLIIGLVFGLLAALMAYLITYSEYTHHYTTTKEPRRIALQAALSTYVIFIVLSMGVGVVLMHYFHF